MAQLIPESEVNLEALQAASIDRPPVVTGTPPPVSDSDPFQIGTLPVQLGLPGDLERTQLKGSPIFRLMPPPPAGQAQNNSSNTSSLLKDPTFQTNQAQTQANAAAIAAQQQTGWQGTWIDSVVYALGAIVEFNAVVYVSLVNQNINFEPDISPTDWQATGQVSFAGAWSSSTNYSIGQIVDSGGIFYIALQGPPNLNETPATSPTFWQAVGGTSQFLGNWSAIVNYQIGNQVIDAAGGGGYYIAIAASLNKQPSGNPSDWQLITAGNLNSYEGNWSSATAYSVGQTVSYQGSLWVATTANTNQTPSTTSSFWTLLGSNGLFMGTWSSSVVYSQNMFVDFNGNLYQAVTASTNVQPSPTATTPWILTGPASLDDLEDGTIYIKGVAYQSAVVTIQNANFEASATVLPPPGWVAFDGGTIAYDTATPQSGTQSVQIGPNTLGSYVTAQKYACQPGDQIVVGGYCKTDGTAVAEITIFFFTGTGSLITLAGASFGSPTSWTFGSGIAVAPAAAVYFQIAIRLQQASAGTAYFDNIFAVKAVDPSNGSLLAKGSVPGTLNSGFSYSSTSSSITPAWVGMAVYRADGTMSDVGSGSQAVSSLGASRTFYFYPYYNEATGALAFVQNSDLTFPNVTGIAYASASSQEATTTTSAALTAAFSVECWMKVASGYAGGGGWTKATNQTGTISSVNTVTGFAWTSGSLEAFYRDSGGTVRNLSSPQTYNDGEWHYVVYTCNPSASQQFLYVDGVQVASGAIATGVSATAGYYRLAHDSGNIELTGTLTEVAVYNYALSAIQVASHFNAMNTISQSTYETIVSGDAPTIWWKSTSGGSTITDSGSIGGNTANLVNSPATGQSSVVWGAVGSPAIAWPGQSLLVAQSQFLQSRVPLSNGGLPMATTASGSGSGSFGGSTTGTNTGCFSGNTKIQTPSGTVAIEDLKPGDTIISKNGPRKVLAVLRHEAKLRTMIDMGKGELVTPGHVVFDEASDKWVPAGKLFFDQPFIEYSGEVFNLTIDAETFDSHSFVLANGICSHNGKVY
jgi:Concanavalin A-like lectin/glucanases superfamily/Hint-domain